MCRVGDDLGFGTEADGGVVLEAIGVGTSVKLAREKARRGAAFGKVLYGMCY